jgi:hypothetical protein
MSSKRQQARNERTLQDLIKSVPGNNVCADCSARNPGLIPFPDLLHSRANRVDRMGKLECKQHLCHFPVYTPRWILTLPSWAFSCVCGVPPCIGSMLHPYHLHAIITNKIKRMGTHISKVKSLSMDSWSNDQVEVCPRHPSQQQVPNLHRI